MASRCPCHGPPAGGFERGSGTRDSEMVLIPIDGFLGCSAESEPEPGKTESCSKPAVATEQARAQRAPNGPWGSGPHGFDSVAICEVPIMKLDSEFEATCPCCQSTLV